MQCVSFYLDDKLFGVDILLVREINPDITIVKVPLTGNEICGLVNIRGQVILIIDVAVILGNDRSIITENSHIVILKTAQEISRIKNYERFDNVNHLFDKPIGFPVDKIGEVLSVNQQTIEPVPPHIDEKVMNFFTGVVRKDNILSLLNIVEIIKTVDYL